MSKVCQNTLLALLAANLPITVKPFQANGVGSATYLSLTENILFFYLLGDSQPLSEYTDWL